MDNIKNITREDSVHVDKLYQYMDRSIGIKFVHSTSDLENSWEESQFEISSKYQYGDVHQHVWDYYLVFCCSFNEVDIDSKLRFKIESDRFCCRKYLLFQLTKKKFTEEGLIEKLFPSLSSDTSIQLIKTESIVSSLDNDIQSLVPLSYFTKEIDEAEISSQIDSLLIGEKL